MQNYFAKNVLKNAGFESGTWAPWVLSNGIGSEVQSTIKKAGTYAAKLVKSAGSVTKIAQGKYPCYPTQRIPVTLWGRDVDTHPYTVLKLYFYDSEDGFIIYLYIQANFPINSWGNFTHTFTVPSGVAKFEVAIEMVTPAQEGITYIDSVFCPAIPLPVLNADLKPASSSNHYWRDQVGTALTSSFAVQIFGFQSQEILLINDSATNYIEFSWEGAAVNGKIYAGEVLSLGNQERESIYLRGQAGGEAYRIIAN